LNGSARIAELEVSLHESKTEDARTKVSLQMREAEIEALRSNLAYSQQVVEARCKYMANIQDRLSATTEERAVLQAYLDGYVEEIDKLRAAIDFGQKVVDERGAQIAELEAVLQRKDAAMSASIEGMEAQLAEFHNSLSWKMKTRWRALRRWLDDLRLLLRAAFSRKLFQMRFSGAGFALTMATRALRHRSRMPLRNWKLSRIIANSDLFDRNWYRETYPDVAKLKIHPVRHYVAYGVRERRDPGPTFSTRSYLQRNPDVAAAGINPLAHYILHGMKEGRSSDALPSPSPAAEASRPRRPLTQDVASVPLNDTPMEVIPSARLIAFYLPQFHPIPQNDEFWGKGFTEWRNVTRATPQFAGHYQPRVPGELGYYDLRIPAIQQRQVELAKRYGLGGFCFYFYWFHGERPLELPLEQYLRDPSLDLPFCLCWANENWTRTWDGLHNNVLLAQAHSPEDDLALIAHLARYLRDPRYIRVDGKPLVIVYRPSLLPNAKETAARWRKWCRDQGIGEIYLCYVQSFEAVDPAQYGFDAATEFPPNNMAPDLFPEPLDFHNPDFSGLVYDWDCFVERSAAYQAPPYTLFRGVCPSWDNEARRPGRGTILLGSTPERYREWLENAVRDTVARFEEPSERLVFVNAWNEWAEGAYLEPDSRYGFAYLQATRDAIEAVSRKNAGATGEGETTGRRIVIVGHDAHPHGAQFLALNLFRQMRSALHLDAECVLLRDGSLDADYAKVGPVHRLHGVSADTPQAQALVDDLRARGFDTVICNTTASGLFVPLFKHAGFRVVSLVHELPLVLETYEGKGLKEHARAIAADADSIVFAGKVIGDGFKAVAAFDESRAVYRVQGLYKQNRYRMRDEIEKARRELRARHGLKSTTKVILAVAFGDHRKGVDLFVNIAARLSARDADVALVWVGECDAAMQARIDSESRELQNLVFAGFTQETDVYFAGADLYALTSREDPFPSVILEAFEVGLPVLAFSGVGAFEQTVMESNIGRLIPAFDTKAFAREAEALLGDGKELARIGQAARNLVRREFSFRQYVYDLAAIAALKPKRVSVIVPNYNYSRHIESRLASILAQTVQPYEIIVLDDASTDGSREWLRDNLARVCPDAVLIENERNSGSAFAQWHAGVRLARGDYVWIAEADDLADPEFLAEALGAFDDPDVVLSYCQSKQMDENGKILCEHYLDYVADVSASKWRDRYVNDGIDEIVTGLSVKNTIPNVSGVVFRREALRAALDRVADDIRAFRVAGDWVTYTEVLREGKIAFSPRPLNLHRRHSAGMTISRFDVTQLREIMSVQKRVRERFETPERFAALAEDYADRLYVQFGLASREQPTLRDNPELAPLAVPQLPSATDNERGASPS
jgi:glycosyltransferase involved in cell wall biosynthesis